MESNDLRTANDVASESAIEAILEAMQGPDENALHLIDVAASSWPADGRLPFLRGAILAQSQRREAAREAFIHSVTLAPRLYPAWFMLGLLELDSGNVSQATQAWHFLEELGQDDALQLFAQGLLLAEEDFDGALASLQSGLARNHAYPEISRYIDGVIARIQSLAASTGSETVHGHAQHFLLGGYLSSTTRH